MKYVKPEILAQNSAQGSYAMGCPAKGNIISIYCRQCERAE